MIKKDIILAIETSCDETSIAVIKNWTEVIALETATSIPLHQETKWVIPEVAARAQYEYILPVLDEVLRKSWMKMEDIDWIAIANWPWLAWSLLIWVSTANTLATIYKKPLYWINHIHWHIFANFLERNPDEIKFPNVVLTVSWWHNEIYLINKIQKPDPLISKTFKTNFKLTLLGQTLDDSAWEAFDKCWRLLWLNYPAGPQVSKLAEKWDKKAFYFPRWMIHSWDLNFSFSWLKTSFLYKVKKIEAENWNNWDTQKWKLMHDLCASLQESICDILSTKVVNAAIKYKAKQIHISWGVSANQRLREIVKEKFWWEVIFPKKIVYCTDNAAMIGAACYFQGIKAKKFVEIRL